jgi:hypothetical protein
MFSTIASGLRMIRNAQDAHVTYIFRKEVIRMHEQDSDIQERLRLLAWMLEFSQTLRPGMATRTLLDMRIPQTRGTSEELTVQIMQNAWRDKCKLINESLGIYMPQEVDIEMFLSKSKPNGLAVTNTVMAVVSTVVATIGTGVAVAAFMNNRHNSGVDGGNTGQVAASPSVNHGAHGGDGDNFPLHDIRAPLLPMMWAAQLITVVTVEITLSHLTLLPITPERLLMQVITATGIDLAWTATALTLLASLVIMSGEVLLELLQLGAWGAVYLYRQVLLLSLLMATTRVGYLLLDVHPYTDFSPRGLSAWSGPGIWK